jgi:hypothetical protein
LSPSILLPFARSVSTPPSLEARKTLGLAVQEIDSIPIAEAIINARWSGVSINVFVEQDYIRIKLEKVCGPPAVIIAGTAAASVAPMTALLRALRQPIGRAAVDGEGYRSNDVKAFSLRRLRRAVKSILTLQRGGSVVPSLTEGLRGIGVTTWRL